MRQILYDIDYCGIKNNNKLVTVKKRKQTHRYRGWASGYQGREGRVEGQQRGWESSVCRHINCLDLNDSFIQITVSNQSILVSSPELGIGHVKRQHREVIPFSDWCSGSKERGRKLYELQSCTHNYVVFGFFSPGRRHCYHHSPT